MNNFLAHDEETRQEMLKSISMKSIDELFKEIPQKAKMSSLNLPDALSEMQVQREIKSISKKNKNDLISFVGAGVYNHFIPAAISQVAQRFEFLTAYTPYQPEISQGTLQIMYEFQSLICNLTGMDVSNASVYDGATACAEAILMAVRISKREKVLVSEALNPEYKKVIETYAWANSIEIEYFPVKEFKTDFNIEARLKTGEYACILAQNPNFFGTIEDINLKSVLEETKTLLAICVDVSSLSILKAPLEYGADIVIGDIQPLGIPMSFGGPHAGFMACKEKFMRQLPGRIAGKTLDKDGNTAFTLTIQTREQHIKREKATSNICSNQALIALCATLYLSLMGEEGFRQVGLISSKNAHDLSKMLAEKGVKTLNNDFYSEFVIEVENANEFLNDLKQKGIAGGIKLDETKILISTTELHTQDDLNLYVG